MPTTFSAAGGDVVAVLNRVLAEHHPQLVEAGVKIGVLMAENADGAALTHGGYPAAATVKVVPLADRVSKGYDAEIRIDQSEWDNIKAPRRSALIDHEATHLTLVRDEYGQVKYDSLGRPKLRSRKGDWSGGDGFAEVIHRHGDHAYERTNAMQVQARVNGALEKHRTLFDDVVQAGD